MFWHRGLIFKLKQCGIGGNLIKWFEDYLKTHLQRVVINRQASQWGEVSAGVPQGSVLGPLLFLLFINDIIHVITHCNICLFADDTCLFIEIDNRLETAELINEDLSNIQNWAKKMVGNLFCSKDEKSYNKQ